jgi:inosine/xanthosine triphosphate pyrophosphatase family protein
VPQNSNSILLATTNHTKQHYLHWLLSNLGIEILTTEQIATTVSYVEDGGSHLANAELKAKAWSKTIQGMAIASDGGVSIPTLGAMWSSLNTNRFMGENATNEQRREGLLGLMTGQSGEKRQISWSEAIAIANKGTVIKTWEENGAKGLLAEKATRVGQDSDFWISNLWYFPNLHKYYTELTKNELSYLGDHWVKLRPKVQAFLRND